MPQTSWYRLNASRALPPCQSCHTQYLVLFMLFISRVILTTFLQIMAARWLHGVCSQLLQEDTGSSQYHSGHDLQENMKTWNLQKKRHFSAQTEASVFKFRMIILWLCLLWGPPDEGLLSDPYTYTHTRTHTRTHTHLWVGHSVPQHQVGQEKHPDTPKRHLLESTLLIPDKKELIHTL